LTLSFLDLATKARITESHTKLHYEVMLVSKPHPLREDNLKRFIEWAKLKGLLI
jgi:hypothetical protein